MESGNREQVCLTFLDDRGKIIAQQYCPVGALIQQPETSQYPSFVRWKPELPRDSRAAGDMTYRMVAAAPPKDLNSRILAIAAICAAAAAVVGALLLR